MLSLGRLVRAAVIALLLAVCPVLIRPTSAADVATFEIPAGDVTALIAAINAANDESVHPGLDVINLAKDGRYELSAVVAEYDGATGLPVITSAITINGNGAIIERRDGADIPCFRLWLITEWGELTLDKVTLRNGCASSGLSGVTGSGGGILNLGVLTLDDSRIAHNRADVGAGISNFGVLTITDSTMMFNVATIGAGISNQGLITISRSTLISNNATKQGGGISNTDDGRITINESNLLLNSACVSGGAIHNQGTLTVQRSTFAANAVFDPLADTTAGGAVLNLGDLTVRNSTFSNNRADTGSAIWNGGFVSPDDMDSAVTVQARIIHSTFFANPADATGAALANTAILEIKNTIVADSAPGRNCATEGTLDDDLVWSGDWVSPGDNLDTDGSCPDFTAIPVDDLNLKALENNGGFTGTHALKPSSRAIDAATDCTDLDGFPLTIDQRGAPRPQGLACDIGAFEHER